MERTSVGRQTRNFRPSSVPRRQTQGSSRDERTKNAQRFCGKRGESLSVRGESARGTRPPSSRRSTPSGLRRVEIRQRREEKVMSPVLSVYRLCLRCGPNIRACEKARGGKPCPAPKMTCATRERHEKLVEEWHRKLVERRACHYPVHFPRRGGDPPSNPPGDSEGDGITEDTRGERRED